MDKNSARFAANFDEYEINASKQMQGYFIITKKGGYSSEIISSATSEFFFKDCVKTNAQMQELLKEKNAKNNATKTDTKAEIVQKDDLKNSKQILENSSQISKNSSQILENSKNSAQKELPSKAFEIKEIKPKKAIFEFSYTKSTEPAFTIEESKPEEPAFVIEEPKGPAFVIEENEEDSEQKIQKIQNEEKIQSEENEQKIQKIQSEQIKKPSFMVSEDDYINEVLDSLPQIETNTLNLAEPENSKQISKNSEQEDLKNSEQNTKNINKNNFAKDVNFLANRIYEIEIFIGGYDELCDRFYFSHIPDNCEYKYSIKKGELRALFIGNFSSDEAKKFIAGFGFETSRQTPKRIEIYVNEEQNPIFANTLFE